jgi:hypothetical protein
MRVTSISLYASKETEVSEAISFSLVKGDLRDRYVARNIVGLDAEDIVPKFYGTSLYSKSKMYNFSLKTRDIAVRIILNPSFHLQESYSDVRDELYKAISATRFGLVTLHLNSGATTVAKIQGYITKFESTYFTELPEVQLTISCDDPLFRAINPVDYAPGDFPVNNPVIIPDSISTAPHGFTMQVTFSAATPSFTIQDTAANPEWTFVVTPTGGFQVGDVLYFSSEFSNKYLYIMRGVTRIDLMDVISPQSIWPILFPGATEFYFVNLSQMVWDAFEYYPAYWGV